MLNEDKKTVFIYQGAEMTVVFVSDQVNKSALDGVFEVIDMYTSADPSFVHALPNAAEYEKDAVSSIVSILDGCPEAECLICGWLACPAHVIEHFWADGCPIC